MADQLGQNYWKDSIEVNSVEDKSISEFKHPVDIAKYFDTSELDLISVTDEIVVTGTKYKTGYFVLIEKQDRGYIFGKIEAIICENNNPVLLLNEYVTQQFDNHSYSYLISLNSPLSSRLCVVDDLLDFHPLDSLEKNGSLFVRLKYYVF